jgi:hypothetical protein
MMAYGRMVRRTAKASNIISIKQAQSPLSKLGQQEPKQVRNDSDRSITPRTLIHCSTMFIYINAHYSNYLYLIVCYITV